MRGFNRSKEDKRRKGRERAMEQEVKGKEKKMKKEEE